MKKHFIIIFFLSLTGAVRTQNLVLNPSFEDTINGGTTLYSNLGLYWIDPTGISTDYYSPYAVALGYGPGYITPDAYLTYQNAQHGVAYVGMVTYEPTHLTKEYARGTLIEPLKKNHLYCVSLYANMADSSIYKNCDFMASFSSNAIIVSPPSGLPLLFEDTVTFDFSDVDTISWFYKEGIYKAKGGEQYIFLGSVTPNPQINCIQRVRDSLDYPQAAYYLIDNVSVTDCTEGLVNFQFPNVFTPNGDGYNDALNFKMLEEFDFEFKLYNRWGNLVFSNNDYTLLWNGDDLNGNRLNDGTYYYTLQYLLDDFGFTKAGHILIQH